LLALRLFKGVFQKEEPFSVKNNTYHFLLGEAFPQYWMGVPCGCDMTVPDPGGDAFSREMPRGG